MSKRTNPDDYAPIVADHVRAAIDRTPWGAIIAEVNPCSSCPARTKIAARAAYCDVCPMRPLMLALAELQLRQQKATRRSDTAPKTAQRPPTQPETADPVEPPRHPSHPRPR